MEAANRRLQEELGFTTNLRHVGSFQYMAKFDNGLTENELDHVLIAMIEPDTTFQPNPDEVATLRWVELNALKVEIAEHPGRFTAWLMQASEMALRGGIS